MIEDNHHSGRSAATSVLGNISSLATTAALGHPPSLAATSVIGNIPSLATAAALGHPPSLAATSVLGDPTPLIELVAFSNFVLADYFRLVHDMLGGGLWTSHLYMSNRNMRKDATNYVANREAIAWLYYGGIETIDLSLLSTTSAHSHVEGH